MKSERIASQSRRPQGWLGEIVARVMSYETAAVNRSAVERLAVSPGEAVIEVGCGPGRTLGVIAGRGAAFVAGVDPSEVMLRLARRRLRRVLREGRAEVSLGEAAKLPFGDARFHAALAVHVVYFWPDASRELVELRRVLAPGGRILLGFKPRDAATAAALPASVYTLRSAAEVERLLLEAGFADASSESDVSPQGRINWTRARVG